MSTPLPARAGLLCVLVLGASLACGGGFDPAGATVVPYGDADGNTVLSEPGDTYPSPGLLAIGTTRVFLAYGYHSSAVVMAVPKDGGTTELIGYPGANLGGLAVEGDTAFVGTWRGVVRAGPDGFEQLGPRNLEVHAIAVGPDAVYAATKEEIHRIDRKDGATTLVASGFPKYWDWILWLDGDTLYYASTEVGAIDLTTGAKTSLYENGFRSVGAMTRVDDALLLQQSIGGKVLRVGQLSAGATVEPDLSETECRSSANAAFGAPGVLWLTSARGVAGAIGKTSGSSGRPGTTIYSTPGGAGGLYRCDVATGTTSDNLAPSTDRVTAVAADADQVFFFDSSLGLLMSRPAR